MKTADLASLQALVNGRVQGVFFRAFVLEHASKLCITGYVRNVSNGSVEVQAEGERKQLEKLAVYLKTGPPAAAVERLVTNWSVYTGNYTSFSMR